MHGSALEGVKCTSLRMLCMTAAHIYQMTLIHIKPLGNSGCIVEVPQILDLQLSRAFHQQMLLGMQYQCQLPIYLIC